MNSFEYNPILIVFTLSKRIPFKSAFDLFKYLTLVPLTRTVIISDIKIGFFLRKESDFVYKIDELIIPSEFFI